MPSTVLTTTGTRAASERKTTLATSPSPNHTEISGIQANSEICLKVLKLGPTRRPKRGHSPSSPPSTSPHVLPMTKPVSSRSRLARRFSQS